MAVLAAVAVAVAVLAAAKVAKRAVTVDSF